jgi:hypothetical protein
MWVIALLLLIVCGAAWRLRGRASPVLLLLAPLYAAAVASSLCRAPVGALDPILAGPRYFFFPYTYLWWMVLVVAALQVKAYLAEGDAIASPRQPETPMVGGQGNGFALAGLTICVMLLCSGIVISSRKFVRLSDAGHMNWMHAIASTENSDKPVAIPILYDGRLGMFFYLNLSPGDSRRLIESSVLDRFVAPAREVNPL